MNKLLLIPTLKTYHALLLSGIVLHTFAAHAEWIQIGLAGKEVTTLAVRKIWSDTTIFAGTHDGVWQKNPGDTGFRQLRNVSPSDPDVFPLNIHTLCFAENKPQLWAGDDSGLAVYIFTSGLPSVWKRVDLIPSDPVH